MARKIDITIGGTAYQVAANFAVIERIEDRMDLFTFMRSAAANSPKMKDIAWVLYCALSEADHAIGYTDVGDMVLQHFGDAFGAATQIAAEAVAGAPEKPSKKKTPTASGPE